MNRCHHVVSAIAAPLWRAALLTSLVALAATTHAQEAVRPFPAAAKRATMQVTYPPEILLNGKTERLSPGARIRGSNNLLVLSGSLVGQTVTVNYLRDAQGMVHEVWVLNATEAQEAREGSTLPPNYVSDATTSSAEAGASASSTAASAPR